MVRYNRVSDEELYFDWLVRSIGLDTLPESFTTLVRTLDAIPFVWHLPMDENRALKVIELREEFLGHVSTINKTVSVLEVLVALSSEFLDIVGYEYQTKRLGDIFWELLDNLGLLIYNDSEMLGSVSMDSVRFTVSIWLDRAFKPNGVGSIFPLEKPKQNQKYTDIWYQMNYYIGERYANCL